MLAASAVLRRRNKKTERPALRRIPDSRASESFKFGLLSMATIYPELEEAVLMAWLEERRKTLGRDDPFVKALGDAEPPKSPVAPCGKRKGAMSRRAKSCSKAARSTAKSTDPITLARRVDDSGASCAPGTKRKIPADRERGRANRQRASPFTANARREF